MRSRQLTVREAVEAAIERVEVLDPAINAVVIKTFDIALSVTDGTPEGPLAGVPMLLKDLTLRLAGTPHTEGSRFLGQYVSRHDSEHVTRLKRAGVAIVGRASSCEFGNTVTTEPLHFGACRNPWDLNRTTGGSSGGSAAAVAAGIVPAAHANDNGGSIRIPASCCGLVGLKPTRGRQTLAPDFGELSLGLHSDHVVSRTVRDSAALLDATAGRAPGDPGTPQAPAHAFLAGLARPPRQLRIAYSACAPTGTSVDPACRTTVEAAAALCADLGHAVTEAAPTYDSRRCSEAQYRVWAATNAWLRAYWTPRVGREPEPGDFEPLTERLQRDGAVLTAVELLDAKCALELAARQIAGFFAEYDVWLTPTLGQPPVSLGHFAVELAEMARREEQFNPFTALANISGHPAISIPFGSHGGLPIGVHALGRWSDELTLLQLAAQIEEAHPWPLLARIDQG